MFTDVTSVGVTPDPRSSRGPRAPLSAESTPRAVARPSFGNEHELAGSFGFARDDAMNGGTYGGTPAPHLLGCQSSQAAFERCHKTVNTMAAAMLRPAKEMAMAPKIVANSAPTVPWPIASTALASARPPARFVASR